MNLRCKSGDRAMVWRNTTPMRCHCSAIGRVVTVTQPLDARLTDGQIVIPLGPAWLYAGPPMPCSHGGPIHELLDADLVPLPSEGEVRERDARLDCSQPATPAGIPVETDNTLHVEQESR